MPRILTQQYTLSVGATRVVYIDCTRELGDASLTGTPTVAEQTTSDLTLGNKAVNTATYTCGVSGRTVAVGKAMLFSVSGGAEGTEYTVRVACDTDSTITEHLVYDVIINWT